MSKCILDLGTNSMGGYNTLVPMLGIDDSWDKVFVEPNPEHYDYIDEQIKSIPNSTFYKKALCLDNKIHTILTRDDMIGDSAATILGLNFIGNSIGSVNQAVPKYLSYEVEGITLEQILSKITASEIYIKMDIEGAEYDVLEHFPFQYQEKIKKIFVEFHAHDEVMRNRRLDIIGAFADKNITLLNWD